MTNLVSTGNARLLIPVFSAELQRLNYVTDSSAKRRRRRQAPGASSVKGTVSRGELPLPWLGMTKYQLYLLRAAQVGSPAVAMLLSSVNFLKIYCDIINIFIQILKLIYLSLEAYCEQGRVVLLKI